MINRKRVIMEITIVVALITAIVAIPVMNLQSNSNNQSAVGSTKPTATFSNVNPMTMESMAVTESVHDEVQKTKDSLRDVQALAIEEEVEYENSMPEYDIPLSKEVQKHIWEMSEKYGLSYEMVLAVIYVESRFDATEKKNGVDFGLMQLNRPSGTLEWLTQVSKNEFGITNFDWKNPIHNTTAGIWYLNWIRDEWKKYGYDSEKLFSLVLLGYNMGMGNAIKYVKSGKDPDKWKYSEKVLEFKNLLESGNYHAEEDSNIPRRK